MTKHQPNVIPLKTRMFLAICALFLLVFVFVELAIGYTYLPGKRGGFLLSGIPTLMIATSAGALLIASVLTIIDHYDKRPNEITYTSAKSVCYKTALALFIGAPFLELGEKLLRLGGVNPFPEFHGIAEKYSFYSPALRGYIQYLSPILNNQLPIVALSFLVLGLAFLVEKFFAGRAKRFVLLMAAIGMLGLSSAWLVNTAKDFLSGEVATGRSASKHIVVAYQEPAKFNAVLLTNFSLGGLMFAASGLVFIGVITNRIKPT